MRLALTIPLALVLGFAPALAQDARVVTDGADFRSEPDGALLARVSEQTTVTLGNARRAGWREAVLEGWIWARSVRENARRGHDLSVAADEGENLRAAPNGRVLARVREGMLLDQVERRDGWVRVRRTGWIAADAIEADVVAGTAAVATAAGSDSWVRAGRRGSAVLGAPEGDTLATARPMAELEIVSREGNWARVRLEGWVWVPTLATPSDSGSVLEDVTPESLAANPSGFRGRLVEWNVQFIALEEAESIRTDLYAGERFILARGPDDRPGFVYIAVPPDLIDRVERLTPLERITVLARVRTGRSSVMDAPVLDLLELKQQEQ